MKSSWFILQWISFFPPHNIIFLKLNYIDSWSGRSFFLSAAWFSIIFHRKNLRGRVHLVLLFLSYLWCCYDIPLHISFLPVKNYVQGEYVRAELWRCGKAIRLEFWNHLTLEREFSSWLDIDSSCNLELS